jgi:hypothetical protein
MSKGSSLSAFALILALLAGGWWYAYRHATQTICGFCRRPISARARVVAEVGGRRKNVCCARCAITEAIQRKTTVRLISVTDYATGRVLVPGEAFFVEGSRRVLCDHDMPAMDEMKHGEEVAFDRCSPGAYAFARREDADAFIRANGGVIRRLNEMLPPGPPSRAGFARDGAVKGVPHD